MAQNASSKWNRNTRGGRGFLSWQLYELMITKISVNFVFAKETLLARRRGLAVHTADPSFTSLITHTQFLSDFLSLNWVIGIVLRLRLLVTLLLLCWHLFLSLFLGLTGKLTVVCRNLWGRREEWCSGARPRVGVLVWLQSGFSLLTCQALRGGSSATVNSLIFLGGLTCVQVIFE